MTTNIHHVFLQAFYRQTQIVTGALTGIKVDPRSVTVSLTTYGHGVKECVKEKTNCVFQL